MSIHDERKCINERLKDAEERLKHVNEKLAAVAEMEQIKTNALQKIAEGSKHAKDIARKALGWPDKHLEQVELLQEENLRLKLELEELQKKIVSKAIEDTLNQKEKPKYPKTYGGWHLCGKCGKIVTNGQVCDCHFNKPPYNPTWPATPPIWCGTSNTSSL